MNSEIVTKSKIQVQPLLLKELNIKNGIAEERKSVKDYLEVVFLTSYPPRECGIATYSKDLVTALYTKFGKSLKLTICPLEDVSNRHEYLDGIKNIFNTSNSFDYIEEAYRINKNRNVDVVMVQHEFGLFSDNENGFFQFLEFLDKPVVITFHTVLPNPDDILLKKVRRIAAHCETIVVMTQTSADILVKDYKVVKAKLTVIPHGTHLVPYTDKIALKEKYVLTNKKVLSTFGLLGPGKSIETTLNALPSIVDQFPETVFLIMGRTHPTLVKQNGEMYRNFLESKVEELGLKENVRFVNKFLPIEVLLEYLQLTDIYLFTSKDPNQAVSGTFSYALSCGCPVVSTPIPHALEVLQNNAGTIFDFENSDQLKQTIIDLLGNEKLRNNMSINGLHTAASACWENSAIAHAKVFAKLAQKECILKYNKPQIKLDHIKKMTTKVGIIQFSKINHPDIETGYTLDDNARALIALCKHFQLTRDKYDLKLIKIYFNFIYCCFRHDGKFLNYLNKDYEFTGQNDEVNLEDACGRAIWALGYLLSMTSSFPNEYKYLDNKANFIFEESINAMDGIHSPRALAFIIKGLFFYNQGVRNKCMNALVNRYARRLYRMYLHESTKDWQWYESYLTYGNSVLPHAMLMAYLMTLKSEYRQTAQESFDFLLSKIFNNGSIKVISNNTWLKKDEKFDGIFKGGEQPIDVAYTILALRLFHKIFPQLGYDEKMEQAFNWFLGENPLSQIIYNPCTGGCYDGLEMKNVNLNQGAESTISYLLARMAF